MKAGFQKLSHSTLNNSFSDFWVKTGAFGFHWHYHPEVEICYVKQGRGKRIIGDSVEDFNDGDLVLVGSNIPHSWTTDELFNISDEQIEVYVIQFDMQLLESLLLIPEFAEIKQLLELSKAGIHFKTINNTALLEALLSLEQDEGAAKLLKLLQVLNLMVSYEVKDILCSSTYKPDYYKYNEERILKVCNYIHEHYKDAIRTDELADLVAMNPAAFCRFFKRIIGKTVIDYTNELRIAYVCNQLQNTMIPIYRIAFDAGFSSVAYFNRVFKKTIHKTPKEYRSHFNTYRSAS